MERNTHVLHHRQCPKCAESGKDRSKDNLAVYSDGHQYCFACGYLVRSPNSLTNLHKRLEKYAESDSTRGSTEGPSISPTSYASSPFENSIPIGPNFDPSTCKEPKLTDWLSKYKSFLVKSQSGLLLPPHYNPTKKVLVFAISSSGEEERPILVMGRYVGSDPKHPKWVVFSGDKKLASLRYYGKCSTKEVLVLVEDIVSCERLWTNPRVGAIPLFGTSIPTSLLAVVRRLKKPVKIWLDPDKRLHSIRHTQHLSQFLGDQVNTILSKKDPKEYSEKEINEFVFGSPESIS